MSVPLIGMPRTSLVVSKQVHGPLDLFVMMNHFAVGHVTTHPLPSKNSSRAALTMSPSKKGFFFSSSLTKANSLADSLPDSPSANSESPLLNSMGMSLSRVSEDRAMLSRHSTGAALDIEKPPERVSLFGRLQTFTSLLL